MKESYGEGRASHTALASCLDDPQGRGKALTGESRGGLLISEKTIPGTPQEFTYDLDGNLLSDGKWNYVWNGENRLVQASNAMHVLTYAYDHQGRMFSKTVDGVETRYIWDDMNIIAELSASHTNYNVWDRWG